MANHEPPVIRRCGTMAVHYRLLEQDPSFRARQRDLEQLTARRRESGEVRRAAPVTIPVVVHVVYNTAAENISTAQIKSQIQVLNRDYRATNPDRSKVPTPWKGLVTDSGVNFALATKDPNGNTTSGITRMKTTKTQFVDDDDGVKIPALGGVEPWPTSRYLNIWVCTLGKRLLGYAQFPGGPPDTDGVVILNTAFGTKGTAAPPFNLGRSATHEVGHWLNLRHIWGDTEDCTGSDFVDDTPNAAGPNFGKPSFPHISCSNGPNGEMFMNYMDYVDDDSMFMFTTQQVARMNAALDGPRSTLGT